jgi:hypothetical protein
MARVPEDETTRYRELGVSGLDRFTGHMADEPEFLGRQWIDTIIRMKHGDAVIGAILKIIKLRLSATAWSIEPADEHSAEAVDVARFYQECLDDMARPFQEIILDWLTCIEFGWSVLEPGYKRRRGDKPRPYAGAPDPESSKYDDGKVGWSDWYPRGHATLWKWEIDQKGRTTHFVQFNPYTGAVIRLPMSRVVLFRTDAYLDNPEGISALRTTWRQWYYKTHGEQVEMIGVERDLAGLPIVWVPPDYLKEDAPEEFSSLVDEMLEVASGVRLDDQAALAMPLAYDAMGNKLFDFTLMSSQSRRQHDTNQIIQRLDHRIALSMIAQLILLGSSDIGSFALASSHQDAFNHSLNAYLSRGAGVINKREFPRLGRLNGIDPRLTPRLSFGQVQAIDIDALSSAIMRFSQSGMRFFPSRETEDHLLRRMGMPIPDDQDRPESGPPLGVRPAQGGGRRATTDPAAEAEPEAGDMPMTTPDEDDAAPPENDPGANA